MSITDLNTRSLTSTKQTEIGDELFCCLYIHGFKSSPASNKAKLTQSFWQKTYGPGQFLAPDVNLPPLDAIKHLEACYQHHLGALPECRRIIIGSSLGGFYATSLVNRFGGRAVLINPACYPQTLLKDYIGSHENPYTGKKFEVHEDYPSQLTRLFEPIIRVPERFLVLLETADKVLDVKDAYERFRNSQLIITGGGDHRYQNYEKHLSAINNFLAKPYNKFSQFHN